LLPLVPAAEAAVWQRAIPLALPVFAARKFLILRG
jgi:hypothetical protein